MLHHGPNDAQSAITHQHIPAYGLPPLGHFLDVPVSVVLITGEVVNGILFCVDALGSNTIVLREISNDGQTADIRIIKFQHIREIHPKGNRVAFPTLSRCNPSVLEEREAAAVAAFESTKHTIGTGVTVEAQDIFDFIHKTHPKCRWTADHRITIMDVTVSPPYGADDCEGFGQPLQRIREVIEHYRERQRRDEMQQRTQQQRSNDEASLATHPNIAMSQRTMVPGMAPTAVMMPPGVPTAGMPDQVQQYAYMTSVIGPDGSVSGYMPHPGPPGVVMLVVQPPPSDVPGPDGYKLNGPPPQGPFYAPVLIAPQNIGPVDNGRRDGAPMAVQYEMNAEGVSPMIIPTTEGMPSMSPLNVAMSPGGPMIPSMSTYQVPPPPQHQAQQQHQGQQQHSGSNPVMMPAGLIMPPPGSSNSAAAPVTTGVIVPGMSSGPPGTWQPQQGSSMQNDVDNPAAISMPEPMGWHPAQISPPQHQPPPQQQQHQTGQHGRGSIKGGRISRRNGPGRRRDDR